MELAGARIGKGDTVLLSIGSANRDPRHFVDPDELRLDRQEGTHLTFGRGAHHCPGKELARIELQVMISKLLAKFPDIKLAEPVEEIRWRPNYTFRAPRSLHVTV
jgi:cytochrome P450